MTKQNRATEARDEKKNRRQVKPAVIAGLDEGPRSQAVPPFGPISSIGSTGDVGSGSIQTQTALLGGKSLHSVQRQALAAEIGRVQGNRHLRQVASLTKQNEKTAPVQRTRGPATVTRAPTGTVIKVCLFNLPGPSGRYIENARRYILNTLGVPETDLILVNSLEHLFTSLLTLRGGPRVNRLIIVSHGREFSYTNLTVSDEGQVRQREGWITPSDVSQAVSTPNAQAVRNEVMAPGAIVEFWGCRIGRSLTALGAWGRATLPGQGAEFRAPTERMGFDIYNAPEFYRQARQDGRTRRVRITNTTQVPPGRQATFRSRLLEIYAQMVTNDEIVETVPARNDDQKYAYMCDLFNRSSGEIRTMRLTVEGGTNVAPGATEWPGLWRTQPYNVTWSFGS